MILFLAILISLIVLSVIWGPFFIYEPFSLMDYCLEEEKNEKK